MWPGPTQSPRTGEPGGSGSGGAISGGALSGGDVGPAAEACAAGAAAGAALVGGAAMRFDDPLVATPWRFSRGFGAAAFTVRPGRPVSVVANIGKTGADRVLVMCFF